MARATHARTNRGIVVSLLGAALLVWNSSTLWVGLQPAAARGMAPAEVTRFGKAKDGIFTPIVEGAKVIVGEGELKKIRANVIKMHGELMGNFIGTANSDFGDFALEKLFEAADEDGSGQLDKEELKQALNKLGFTWVDEDKVDKVAKKGDKDGDGLIDLEEFKKMAPTVLKQNLMKLAKENGSELGMLS
mmetsp:Transcript_87498/g.173643  ORF Transcript_87498/g.173643 Transcript_87498/m.173643 type:complete len:190 (-) Transcript_87498:44-613(-)